MMHCDTVKELLSDYIDNSLEPNVISQVSSHLETCLDCEKLVQRVKAITLQLKKSQTIKTSAEFDKNLRARIMGTGDNSKSSFPIRGMVYGLSGLAAAVAVYFITTTTILSTETEQMPPTNFQTRSNVQQNPNINQQPAVNIQPVQNNQSTLADDSVQSRPSPLEDREIQLVDDEQ
jgi:predicted anti-sigma-YlaC factor YlaD